MALMWLLSNYENQEGIKYLFEKNAFQMTQPLSISLETLYRIQGNIYERQGPLHYTQSRKFINVK